MPRPVEKPLNDCKAAIFIDLRKFSVLTIGEGRSPKKIIVVPGRLVNVVV